MTTPPGNYEGERAELAAILASGIFDRSPNLYRFLTFVCDKYFRGESDEVKEYSVAVEALGRPADFDQKRDSIVRVEAHRLRKRLDEYYKSSDAVRRFRVELPSGSYVPQFIEWGAASPDSVPGTLAPHVGHVPPAQPPPKSQDYAVARSVTRWNNNLLLRAVSATALALLLIVSIFAWTEMSRSRADSKAATERTHPLSTSPPPANPAATENESGVRILAGSSIASFVDRSGRNWTGDAYFTGGTAVESPWRGLRYTSIPELYAHRREGEFSYDIPVAPGNYELRLHFSEPIFGANKLAGGGETSRLFAVKLNGELILSDYDIIADSFGEDNANVKLFKDVQPAADGKVHLQFIAGTHESPILSALELVPSQPGRMNPVRILASDRSFQDSYGNFWQADNYVLGGRSARRSPAEYPGLDANLFASERYGNFTYMIPVATDSRYKVRLYLCERWWGPGTHAGGGAGSRVFDVYCNGQTLLGHFDVFKQAGGMDTPVMREFSGVAPNAQGKLILQFVPRTNYAMVNAIEVIDEGE